MKKVVSLQIEIVMAKCAVFFVNDWKLIIRKGARVVEEARLESE